jgi:hypothetical protein
VFKGVDSTEQAVNWRPVAGYYESNIVKTSVRNTVFFSARFYCALITLHVSAPIGGHLQVVHKHKNIQGSHYIFNNI